MNKGASTTNLNNNTSNRSTISQIFHQFHEFYVLNSETLLRSYIRPQWAAIILLAIESCELFSLILNETYFKVDSSGQVLSSISLHRLASNAQSTFILFNLALTITILITLINLFAFFCLKHFQERSIPLLSALILCYNHVMLVPSIALSAKGILNDSFNGIKSIYVANIFMSLLLSLVCAMHSGRFYAYFNVDGLAKRGSTWDYMKYVLLSLVIFLIEIYEKQRYYQTLIIIYAAMNSWDGLHGNLFYKPRTAKTYISLNFLLIVFSIIDEVQVQSLINQAQVTGAVLFLCTSSLTFLIGDIVVEKQIDFLMESIDVELQGLYAVHPSNAIVSRAAIDFRIDFFTRRLMERTELLKKQQHIHASFFNEITRFPLLDESRSNSTNHLGAIIEEEETFAVASLKEQVKRIMLYYEMSSHTSSSSSGNNSTKSSGKKDSSNELPSIQSLFYLLEISANYPKLAIKLQEFMNHQSKRKSMGEEAIIRFLECEMEKREESQRDSSVSQPGSNQGGSKLDLSIAFTFQEDLKDLSDLVICALKGKIKLVNRLSLDPIDLLELQEIGNGLLKLYKRISLLILQLRARSIHCNELTHISRIFIENLWIDPSDSDLKLLWIGGQSFQDATKSNHQMTKWLDKKYSIHRIDFKEINQKECTIMTSLSHQKLGKIVKVSDNCKEITGFTTSELLNQSLGIIQPPSIAINHNNLIKKGIENGLFRYYNKGYSPLILKRKDGFGVRVSLEFQIHTMGGVRHSTEIGLIAKIQIQERYSENYFLVDISMLRQKAEVISRNLFDELFNRYFACPNEVNGIDAGMLLPVLACLARYFSKSNERFAKFETLAFFPSAKKADRPNKRRLYDSSMNLLECCRKRHFSIATNDIYLVQMNVTNYKREGDYHLLLVKFKQFRQLRQDVEIAELVKGLLIPHFVELNAISHEESNEVADYILSSEKSVLEQNTNSVRQNPAAFQNNLVSNSTFSPTNKSAGGIAAVAKKLTGAAGNTTNAASHKQYSKVLTTLDDNNNTYSLNFVGESNATAANNDSQTFPEIGVDRASNSNNNNNLQNYEYMHSLMTLSPRPLATDYLLDTQEGYKLIHTQQQQQQQLQTQHHTGFVSPTQQHNTNHLHSHTNLITATNVSQLLSPSSNTSNHNNNNHLSNSFAMTITNRTQDRIEQSFNYSIKQGTISNNTTQQPLHPQQQQQQQFSQPKSKWQNAVLSSAVSPTHNILTHLESTKRSSVRVNSNNSKIVFSQFESQRDIMNRNNQSNNNNLDDNNYNSNRMIEDDGSYHPQDYKGNKYNNNDDDDDDSETNEDEVEEDMKARNSISSHRSSQSNSLRGTLYQRIFSPKQSPLHSVLLVYISLSFIGILLIVAVTYFSVRSQISTQQLSFQFSWWQDQISNYILSMFRFTKAHALLVLNGYQLTPEMVQFRDSIAGRIQSNYDQCLEQFKSVGQYSFSDLYLVELLHTIEMQFQFYSDPLNFHVIPVSIFGMFAFYTYTSTEFSNVNFPFPAKNLLEYEQLMNMAPLEQIIVELTQKQSDSQQDLIDTINLSVVRSLILILCISNAIALVFLPFFYKFQTKKEFIMRLFASLEPISLKRMHESAVAGMAKIQHSRFKGSNSNITNGFRGVQQQTHAPTTTTGNKKRSTNSLEVLPFVLKKRKNTPTIPLSKIGFRLLVQILIIVLTVNVQPFVNVFLISAQISEARTELQIVKGLYSLQSSLMQCQYFMFAHTAKLADPTQSIIPLPMFELSFNSSLTQLNTGIQTIQSTYQSLSSNSRYVNTTMGLFLENIFAKDLCDSLNTASPSYFLNNGADAYNNTLCQETFGGVLTQGYLQAINMFQMTLAAFNEIVVSTDELYVKIPKYIQFYTDYSITRQEDLFTMVKIATMAVINCISEEKEKYYSTINLTQIMLFLFEMIFLVLLFPTAVSPFFRDIKQDMKEIINMLSILQIQYIVENSYISNFIKSFSR